MEQEIIQISRSSNIANVESKRVNAPMQNKTNVFSNISNLSFKLQPDTYDEMGSLKEFFTQFELIVRVNGWTEELKMIALTSSLRGKVRSGLDCVKELEKLKFDDLKSKLELRSREEHLS